MKRLNYFILLFIIAFSVFMLCFPSDCRDGAKSGLLLCGNVIIPSLFPFTFCVLFITNSGITEKFKFLNKLTGVLFGLSAKEFSIMLLSFIGGYPTGAKLIDKYSAERGLSPQKANLMLCYCVNAGPAFVVMAVGVGILKSKLLGWLLLSAHLLASLVFALLLRPFIAKHKISNESAKNGMPIFENFVASAADSSSAVLSVCIYVILFSVINVFFEEISLHIPFIKNIIPLLEVTTAVTESRNLYHIAFLLGFGGICVWCQAAALIKSFKINFGIFSAARVLHGILSMATLYLLMKIFKLAVPTFSNAIEVTFAANYKGITLTLSLIAMGILFIISTFNKNAGKSKRYVL